MKLKISKKFSLALCAVICLVALGLALLVPTAVEAYTSSGDLTGSNIISLKISDDAGNAFDPATLQTLINTLAGSSSNVEVEALKTKELALNERKVTNTSNPSGKNGNSTTLPGTPTSGISSLAGKTIIVELGGIKWIAVYLSTADHSVPSSGAGNTNSGDVILTLWQAYSEQTSKWNNYGTNNTDGAGKYPANMYGTSYMRAVTLGNGGSYATSANAALKDATSEAKSSQYYNFLHSSVADYIVAPRYVSWQYDQDRGKILDGNGAVGYINNESWGLESVGHDYHNNSYRYDDVSTYPNYSDWADDLIWLPSWTETGNSSGSGGRGIWDLYGKLEWGNSSGTNTWLRSAFYNYCYHAYSLTSAGVGNTGVVSTSSFLVRPALHLNLTSAAEAAGLANGLDKPTSKNESTVYNGEKQYLDLGVATDLVTNGKVKVSITSSTVGTSSDVVAIENHDGQQAIVATKAGTYKAKVEPLGDCYWRNTSNAGDKTDTSAVEFTFTITNADITLNGVSNTQTFTYSLSDIATPIKHKIEIAISNIVTVGSGNIPNVTYAISSTSGRTSSDWDGNASSGYSVYKAGTYIITATITADNHNNKEQVITVTIGKATATVTATCDENSTVYTNGKLPTLSGSAVVNGVQIDGEFSWITQLSSFVSSGTYPCYWKWVSGDDSVEDSLENEPKNLKIETINPAIIKPTAQSKTTVVYNGTEQTLDLLAELDYSKVEINGNYTGAQFVQSGDRWVLSAKNAGVYTISFTPKSEYHWDGNESDRSTLTFTFEVQVRTVVVETVLPSGVPSSITFGTNFTLPSGEKYWTYANSSPYQFVDEADAKFSAATVNATSVGSHKLQLAFEGDTVNYKVTVNLVATVTVTNAKLDISQLEAYYRELAEKVYSPSKSYDLTPNTGYIFSKNNVELTNLAANVTSSSVSISELRNVCNAGIYTLTIRIEADNHDTEILTITVVIAKATPSVSWKTDQTTLIYTSKSLPEITATATIDGSTPVEGSIRFTRTLGEVTGDSDNLFSWQWTPADLNNYNIVTGNDIRLNIRFVGVRAISYIFTPGDTIFYDTDDINELKNYLTVVVDFNDDTSRELAMNEYTLTCQGGNTLVVGDVRVTISYLSAGVPVTRSFDVSVQKWQGGSSDTPIKPNPGKDTINKISEFFDNTPLPLGYAALVLGAMLLIIIILAIAARKPKQNK